MRLAIDGMGNDRGAAPIVEGVLNFLAANEDCTVLLVGQQDKLSACLNAAGAASHPRLEIVHASQIMEMHDKVGTLREKRDSSIMRLVAEVKEGRADAMVALGNTAAAVGAASLGLRLLKNVHRPGIAVPMPARHGVCVTIDMGANTAAKPRHLLDYAVMASIYAEKILGVAKPRVGLLNVGEEAGKGNEFLREAFDLLEAAPVNFVGNVEGGDVFSGKCDVVVCDGFVGNVVLKASEEIAMVIAEWLKAAFKSSFWTKAGAFLARNAFAILKRRISYDQYGGAPLLGINGICIIGHGKSNPVAVANALRVAKQSVAIGLNNLIREQLEVLHPQEAKADTGAA